MTFSASWTNPNSITNRLVGWVARLPARVQTKLLIAFLSIVGLLIVLGAVGLQVLSGVNDQTNELIKLQRRIAAYRQVQHDTTNQLYSISTALLLQDDRMLDAALRQLNQFGYDLDRMEFVAETEAEVLGQVRQEYERLAAGVTHVAELFRAGRTEEARKVQLDEIMPSADRLERLTNQLVNMAEADMVAAIETTEGAYGTSRLIVVSFAVGSILLALGLGYIISWSLIEPVKKIETRLSQIAAGDFAQQVAVANRDELGVLAGNVNQTSEQLGRLYRGNRDAHPAARRGIAAADSHRRRSEGHQPLDIRSAGRARYVGGIGCQALPCRQGWYRAVAGWRIPLCVDAWLPAQFPCLCGRQSNSGPCRRPRLRRRARNRRTADRANRRRDR